MLLVDHRNHRNAARVPPPLGTRGLEEEMAQTNEAVVAVAVVAVVAVVFGCLDIALLFRPLVAADVVFCLVYPWNHVVSPAVASAVAAPVAAAVADVVGDLC